MSQTPTLSILTICNPSAISTEKWPRFPPKLRNLKYELSQDKNYYLNHPNKINDPVKDLRHCTKLQSLDIKSSFIDHRFSDYSISLKRLALQTGFPSDSSLRNFHRLESIHFTINSLSDLKNICASLSKLPSLQEISLEPRGLSAVDLSTHLKQITSEAKSFKKLQLIIECALSFTTFGISNGSGRPHILKTLENFHKLTHLSLALSISSDFFVGSILEGIRNQSRLQYLKLRIINGMHFEHHTTLQLLCKEISTLSQLQHLKLSFQGNYIPHGHKLENFLLDLDPVFNKPVKIKTFSLECNQLSPGEVYFELVHMLESLKNSLEKLKVDIGGYCFQKKEHSAVISFFKSLVNIRELYLPGVWISDKKFLNDFTETVLQYKYLRVLNIGIIKSTVTKPAFYLAIDAILKKRGLEGFQYWVQDDFMDTLKAKSKTDRKMNLVQVRRENPSLEDMPHYPLLFEDDISDVNW